jgi:hypothetical protein
MNRTQRPSSFFDRRRPLLSDAPDWFNQARARANDRRNPPPRLVPLPAIVFKPANPVGRLWLQHHRNVLRGLPFVALPIVFGIGFWARGVVGPAGRETAGVGEGRSRAAVAPFNGGIENKSKVEFTGALPERTLKPDEPARNDVAARVDHPPSPPAVAGSDPALHRVDVNSQPENVIAAIPDQIHPAPPQPVAQSSPALVVQAQPADGFSLKPAGGVKQVSAEIIRPTNAWFETAVQAAECTTGSCPAPLARLDRKLNTALEWSPTPAAAAEMAAREGKLVFLIHVSGNFSQPGFT